MLLEHCRLGTVSDLKECLHRCDYKPCDCAAAMASALQFGPLHKPIASALHFSSASQAAFQLLRDMINDDGTVVLKGNLCRDVLTVVRPSKDGEWGWIGPVRRTERVKYVINLDLYCLLFLGARFLFIIC